MAKPPKFSRNGAVGFIDLLDRFRDKILRDTHFGIDAACHNSHIQPTVTTVTTHHFVITVIQKPRSLHGPVLPPRAVLAFVLLGRILTSPLITCHDE